MHQKKYFIHSYGCQMNVYDGFNMAERLKRFGAVEEPSFSKDVDIVILNTCYIREKASEKVFSHLGRLKKWKQQDPHTKRALVVVGCVAQAQGYEIFRRAPHVDIVLGSQSYHHLVQCLQDVYDHGKRALCHLDFEEDSKFDDIPLTQGSPATAFLTIQEGCDKFCSYCCVPFTRGAEYSRRADAVLRDMEKYAHQGVKEITFLGQNVNGYQDPHTRMSFGKLLQKAAASFPDIRLRYVSAHPHNVDDDEVEAFATCSSVMPLLHMPVQSGSDRILNLMNRGYTYEQYAHWMDRFRRARHDVAFSTDIIVGFCSETEEDFEQTLAMVRHVSFAFSYSFYYSPRPGTASCENMEDDVPLPIKKERLKRLQELLFYQQNSFQDSFLHQEVEVLIECIQEGGQAFGKSPHGQTVLCQYAGRVGDMVRVRITHTAFKYLKGEVCV